MYGVYFNIINTSTKNTKSPPAIKEIDNVLSSKGNGLFGFGFGAGVGVGVGVGVVDGVGVGVVDGVPDDALVTVLCEFIGLDALWMLHIEPI